MKQFFKEVKIWYILKQLLEGLQALHSAGIAHRDIKAANVFLSKNGDVKLGDLNVSAIEVESMMRA